MPSEAARREDRRMTIFDAIAPTAPATGSGSRPRPRRTRQAEHHRRAGHSICWIVWSETLQRFVTIPED
jgi:hypothetical protein